MSCVLPPLPPTPEQARSESIGYLALIHLGKRLPLQVCCSATGYYIGTTDDGEPASRESCAYFHAIHDARRALATGRWLQRTSP